MRRISLYIVAFCFSLFLAGSVQAQDTFELFGGYSYMWSPVTVNANGGCPVSGSSTCSVIGVTNRTSLNGFELAGAGNLTSWLGVAADFGGFWTTQGASTHWKRTCLDHRFVIAGEYRRTRTFCSGGARETTGISGGLPFGAAEQFVRRGVGSWN